GHVIFISYFFSPDSDDRCFSADSGSAIRLDPSMIRMLGPFRLGTKWMQWHWLPCSVPHRYRH
ncbi:hypothetical protein, partial [Bradyrhizobium pachyrhizi]|uniref:hypothetical protein n=1 Tax=Bradyrhizobium pachyrhizi TaxID=280333 RepID=UPI001AEBB6E2